MSAPLKPGWRMTVEQVRLFWRLWSAACRYQRWTTSESEARRHEILMECGFASAKDIDHTDGFDRVKNRLEALAGRIHNGPDDAGRRRRVLVRVGQAFAELNAANYPPHSVKTILVERFKVIEGIRTVADLNTEELINLSRTLAARLASWKKRSVPPVQDTPAMPNKPLYSALETQLQAPFFVGS
jgi:hypothetical protein